LTAVSTYFIFFIFKQGIIKFRTKNFVKNRAYHMIPRVRFVDPRSGKSKLTVTLNKEFGFTVVELLLVVTVVGILAIIALVSIGNPRGSRAIGEAEALKSNLRFTQSRAMSDLPGNIWSLNITSSNYRIRKNGAVPNPAVNLPGSNSGTYTLPSGQSITSGTGQIRFNFRGQPVNNTGTPLAANYTITVTGAPTITVTRETGFVP
jgi:Tfp pilus assembly protein FimT